MSYEFRGQTRAKAQAETGGRATRRRVERPAGAGAAAAPGDSPDHGRSLMQVFAALMGAAFLLVGLAGFVPGLTSDYGRLGSAGTGSQALLLGLFQVSVLHNIVHLLFGVGLLAAARYASARAYLLGGGIVYLGVTVYGFLIDRESDLNFLPVNPADNLLHLGLALAMVGLGLVGLRAARGATTR